MSSGYSETVLTAQEYYNSDDADRFYATIWGGEDIHIGLYEKTPGETILAASRRTVETMAAKLKDVKAGSRILDLGAGYGGSARFLVDKFPGCHVTCLNLSEVQNDRNRRLNAERGITDKIDVIDGNFEDVPLPDASFDVIWSQDAFLHSGRREQVMNEIDRLTKPGAQCVFTDPMPSDDCPEGVLQPVLDRIHLETMGSPGFYESVLTKLGWKLNGFENLSEQLVNHYSRVREEIIAQEEKLKDGVVSADYIERMKKGLQHWVDAGNSGYLCWGILDFSKP